MGRNDWYRRTSWTEQDREDFYARVKRCRSEFNKAQYIRIQALCLQREADPPLYGDAIELLDYLLEECPHPAELAGVYMQKAQCLEAIGQLSSATESYLFSLSAEKEASGKTRVPLEFAMFVMRHDLRQYYGIVAEALLDSETLMLFPEGQYVASAAFAIMAYDSGNIEEARRFAQMALAAVKKEDSGLTYHPRAGLVEDPDPDLLERLENIAGA
jgi:tetratricopeptide (TPR) repeat protein